MTNGTLLTLKGVKHILDLRLNLISPGKLDDEGYCSTFGDGRWKLSRGSMVVARGEKISSLYVARAKVCRDSANAVSGDGATDLWHNRLSHISEKGLMILARKNLLPEMKGEALEKCTHCFAGKQNRVSFTHSASSRKSGILDLVHSDICGPMKTRTLGGSLYFVTFIDDHSRKLWVYTLKSKDQVFETFKQFQALVERQSR